MTSPEGGRYPCEGVPPYRREQMGIRLQGNLRARAGRWEREGRADSRVP